MVKHHKSDELSKHVLALSEPQRRNAAFPQIEADSELHELQTRKQILNVDFRSKTVFSDHTFAFRGPFIFSRAGLMRKTFIDQDDMRAGIRQATLCPNNNEIDLPDK